MSPNPAQALVQDLRGALVISDDIRGVMEAGASALQYWLLLTKLPAGQVHCRSRLRSLAGLTLANGGRVRPGGVDVPRTSPASQEKKRAA